MNKIFKISCGDIDSNLIVQEIIESLYDKTGFYYEVQELKEESKDKFEPFHFPEGGNPMQPITKSDTKPIEKLDLIGYEERERFLKRLYLKQCEIIDRLNKE